MAPEPSSRIGCAFYSITKFKAISTELLISDNVNAYIQKLFITSISYHVHINNAMIKYKTGKKNYKYYNAEGENKEGFRLVI